MDSEFKVGVLKLGDNVYSSALASIPKPPVQLYFKGNVTKSLFSNCLAIVGSRNISGYGIAVLEHLFTTIKHTSLTIVSGFMRGVDYLAHTLAVKYGIPTIAVLPCGINSKYPRHQQKLYQDILESSGLIISEYAGYSPARTWTFVRRNRVVAGLSQAVLVIEAGENSGSLITYKYAKEFNRSIMAVPGDIFKVSEKGICQILAQGATPVFSGCDVLEKMGLEVEQIYPKYSKPVNDVVSKKIITALFHAPTDINSLSESLEMEVSQIVPRLTNLQIEEIIKEIKGIYYVVQD